MKQGPPDNTFHVESVEVHLSETKAAWVSQLLACACG